MQKHVNLVDLVRGFPTNIYLQILASIEKRTSPIKFAYLAEKLEKGSTSNLSTKGSTGGGKAGGGGGSPRPMKYLSGKSRSAVPAGADMKFIM